jgi:hypothetical protein
LRLAFRASIALREDAWLAGKARHLARDKITAKSNVVREASCAVEITRWLVRWREGDTGALEHLMSMVYAELRLGSPL